MTKKKAKRKLKEYTIEVRCDVSYVTAVKAYGYEILAASEAAMNTARSEAIRKLPDAATLNQVEVIMEWGWEEGNGT